MTDTPFRRFAQHFYSLLPADDIGKRRDADPNEPPKQIESPAIQAAEDP
jgi:hypothetical protein